jgi:hypothetical protein
MPRRITFDHQHAIWSLDTRWALDFLHGWYASQSGFVESSGFSESLAGADGLG